MLHIMWTATVFIGVCAPPDMPATCDAILDLFLSVGLERGMREHETVCSWRGIDCAGGGEVTAIHLSGLNLTGTLPTSLGALKRLRTLDVHGNALSGTVPSSFYKLHELTKVRLDHNLISGTLSGAFTELRSVSAARLDHNLLSGSLASDLSPMLELRSLDVGHNVLTGPLPHTLPRAMEALSVWGNSLSGELPETWHALPALAFLDFSSNFISGSIPHALQYAEALEILLGYSNKLSTVAPSVGCGAPARLSVCDLHDNAFLCGTVPACARRVCRASTLCLVPRRSLY